MRLGLEYTELSMHLYIDKNYKYLSKYIIIFYVLFVIFGFVSVCRLAVKEEDEDILSDSISTYDMSVQRATETPQSIDCQSDFAINSVLAGKYNDAKVAFDKYDKLIMSQEVSVKQKDEFYIFLVAYAKAKMHQKFGEKDQACKYWRIAKKDAEIFIRLRGRLSAFDDFVGETEDQARWCW